MGIVYKAEDTKLDRTVAIKVLPSAALASEGDRTRFYREAKAAAQLHHPNIASVFEIVEAELDLDEGSVGSTSIVSSLSTTGFGFFDIHPEDGRVLVFSAGSSSNSTSTTPNQLILDVVVNWTGTLPKPQK